MSVQWTWVEKGCPRLELYPMGPQKNWITQQPPTEEHSSPNHYCDSRHLPEVEHPPMVSASVDLSCYTFSGTVGWGSGGHRVKSFI